VHLTTRPRCRVPRSFEANVDKLAQPPCQRAACSPSFGIALQRNRRSKLMEERPLRFAAGQSFSILRLAGRRIPPLPKFENAKVVTMRQKDLHDGTAQNRLRIRR